MTTQEIDREVRQDVADVLVRYASGIDRRDWDRFRTCFTDDCAADYGAIGAWSGADAITDWMQQVHDQCGHTMHRITNQDVRPTGDGVSARSYVEAIVMGADNQAGVRVDGYYDDELVRTDDGWKIARRTFTTVLQSTIVVSPQE